MVLGNLVSAAAGFFLASKGRVDGFALAATLIGISLVVASGCVFNNCIDRKIDRKMVRTRNRGLAKGLISLNSAMLYATILGAAGMALLWAATNLLCVVITLAGLVIYVGVYSLYMKRNSVYSTLIGSLAGAAPPLAGYCAVTGRFDMGAVILLSIFTLWQMPHCYAIAVYRLEDYTAAGIPVLPVKHSTACAAATCIENNPSALQDTSPLSLPSLWGGLSRPPAGWKACPTRGDISPSPSPLPPGERDLRSPSLDRRAQAFTSPSLDGRGKGEGGLGPKLNASCCRKHMVGYILAFMAATLTLTLAGYTGYSFFAVATVLCLSWLYLAWSGYKAPDERLWAKRLFIFSILTISILSVMMSVDFTAPVPPEILMSYAP